MRRHDYDAVILGGGMAGLAAADALGQAGAGVLLVEARDRLGGRVWTEYVDGWPLPVELGAEFVHGAAPLTRELARAAGTSVRSIDERHLVRTPDGFAPMAAFWRRVETLLSQLDPAGPDCSVAEFLAVARVSAEERRAVTAFVEGFHGGTVERVSVQSLAIQQPSDEEQGRVAGGYETLVAHLRRRLDAHAVRVLRATPVETVRWSREHADVALADGSAVRARAAVVAVPHAVLADGGVRFAPPLGERAALLDRIATGDALRVVLRLSEPVWERAGLRDPSFLHDWRLAFPTWWTAWPDPTPQLTAWCGGPGAATWGRRPTADIVGQALGDLARLLDLERAVVARACIAAHCHPFPVDPWARGGYSYVAVGGSAAAAALVTARDDAVCFAGEYTVPDDAGTVEAALASGRRAAARVAARLG